MEKTQIQALVITIVFVTALGYFIVPEGLVPTIEIPKWSVEKKSTTKTKKSKTSTKVTPVDDRHVIDAHYGVPVYHNGSLTSVYGRNVTSDGYNLGLKYQCVEFVKRFYYQHYGHKMQQSYGHAKEFFDWNVGDGEFNVGRGLNQYRNGSNFPPKENAIIVFRPDGNNSFGHVGLVSSVNNGKVEMISQNNGRNQKPRSSFPLIYKGGKYFIDHDHVLGWLSR